MFKRIIKLVISLGFWTAYGLRKLIWRLLGIDLLGTCVVLVYHAVTNEQRGRFAKQMDFLAKKSTPIRADFEGRLEKNVHYSVVNIDDGFSSVIKIALPETIKRQIHVTLFIPSGQLGQYPAWCKEPNFKHRFEIIVTADQLRSFDKDLVSIGSHSRTHPNLLDMSVEEARKEIWNSKEDLESILGHRINLFAFPGGWHNQSLIDLAKQAGYKRVFTVLPKFAFSEPSEFTTGRVLVSPNDSFLEFRLKVVGAYRWEPFAFVLKKKVLFCINKVFSIQFKRKRKVNHENLKF